MDDAKPRPALQLPPRPNGTMLAPPEPLLVERPGTLRWFVGSPEGPRSSTWSVVGHSNAPEAFVSTRSNLGTIKLNLHDAMYRLAFTDEWWPVHAADPEQDRLVSRWEKPPHLAQGWRNALVIDVPSSSLGSALPEKRAKDGNLVWFPAPGPGRMLRFAVLIRESGAVGFRVDDAIGEVGRMPLGGGAAVWVVAFEFMTTPEFEAELVTMRAQIREVELNPAADPAKIRGWAWGTLDQGGVPAALDLGPVPSGR